MLSDGDQYLLLQLARRVLEARVRGERADGPPAAWSVGNAGGAFVTIHCRGELRACLGRLGEVSAIDRVIARLAEAVADSDPRFDPVRPDELPEIDIEISLMGPGREISSLDEIDIGRHGLIIEQHRRRGVLLPQVAVAHAWDRIAFVEHACIKAALPRDAWRSG